jgi:formate C-acetyltransferase
MMDLSAGGAVYNFTGCGCGGLANAADSLAAVKKLVYEEKMIGRGTLLDALHNNFEGVQGERIRQLLINRAPKYGNEDDDVDLLAKELVESYCNEVRKQTNPRGGTWIPGLHNFFFMQEGREVGATPDGRRAKDPLAGHTSPAPGRDVKGPIAAIKSFVKLDHTLTPNGAVLDLKLHPTAVKGTSGTEKLMALMKTFMELNGMTVQFNIVDIATLRDAQENPENYKNLLVRVYGFSAYFVTLAPEYQEHVIARTEHSM